MTIWQEKLDTNPLLKLTRNRRDDNARFVSVPLDINHTAVLQLLFFLQLLILRIHTRNSTFFFFFQQLWMVAYGQMICTLLGCSRSTLLPKIWNDIFWSRGKKENHNNLKLRISFGNVLGEIKYVHIICNLLWLILTYVTTDIMSAIYE